MPAIIDSWTTPAPVGHVARTSDARHSTHTCAGGGSKRRGPAADAPRPIKRMQPNSVTNSEQWPTKNPRAGGPGSMTARSGGSAATHIPSHSDPSRHPFPASCVRQLHVETWLTGPRIHVPPQAVHSCGVLAVGAVLGVGGELAVGGETEGLSVGGAATDAAGSAAGLTTTGPVDS